MPPITKELLRKRAEHNEGIISTLEELTLHQEEIEKIEVVGTVCRQLKILYLQNNIIGKLEGLHHLKQLEYLNLAMNNIQKIEGLGSCEFLNKLDLTLNFVDFDELEASVNHLQPLTMLRELYMMGNPAQADWPGFNRFVIASLPQLEFLDGKQISRSDRILASQEYATLLAELRPLAEAKRAEKAAKQAEREAARLAAEAAEAEEESSDDDDDEEGGGDEGSVLDAGDASKKKKKKKKKKQKEEEEWDANEETEHSPEERVRMQRQTAKEKKEKEDREKEMQPRKRDFDAEHKEAVAQAREREANGSEVKQCNDGKLDFKFDEWTRPGEIILTVGVPRYMDSSLMDVDVHPWYVSIVVKNKTLRLKWPEEVVAANAKAQRSKTTGELVITAPAQDPSSAVRARRERLKHKEEKADAAATATVEAEQAASAARGGPKLLDQMVAESRAAAIDIRNIVPKSKSGKSGEKENDGPLTQSAAGNGGGSRKAPLITAVGECADEEGGGVDEEAPGALEPAAVAPSTSKPAAAAATAPATSSPQRPRPPPAALKAVSCAAPPPPLF